MPYDSIEFPDDWTKWDWSTVPDPAPHPKCKLVDVTDNYTIAPKSTIYFDEPIAWALIEKVVRQRAAAVEETIAGYLKRYPGCSIERVTFTDNRIVERVICREARA